MACKHKNVRWGDETSDAGDKQGKCDDCGEVMFTDRASMRAISSSQCETAVACGDRALAMLRGIQPAKEPLEN